MKTILEFGVRKGFHVDNQILPSVKLGARMAANLVAMLTNDPHAPMARPVQWLAREGRTEWQSETHFVALTKLDGELRGAASAYLWRKKS